MTSQVPVSENGLMFYKTPDLPTFSGAVPVPKGDGSYEQFIFQIQGLGAITLMQPLRVV